MLKKQSAGLMLWSAIIFVNWNALLLLFFWTHPPPGRLPSDSALGDDPASLTHEVIYLAKDAEAELARQLLQQIKEHYALLEAEVESSHCGPSSLAPCACDPLTSCDPHPGHCLDRTVGRCLDTLLHYRPSAEHFPIIVSQDCGHEETAQVIASYGTAVTHIWQPALSNIVVQPDYRKFQGYYKIARHYRWALGQIFDKFKFPAAVVVEEDDPEVAPDFFEYFQATYPLLRTDPSLWCVCLE